jgi:hypothetical protein
MEAHKHQEPTKEERRLALEDRQIEAVFELAYAAELFVQSHLEEIADQARTCPTANELVHASNLFTQADGALLDDLELERFDVLVADLESTGTEES